MFERTGHSLHIRLCPPSHSVVTVTPHDTGLLICSPPPFLAWTEEKPTTCLNTTVTPLATKWRSSWQGGRSLLTSQTCPLKFSPRKCDHSVSEPANCENPHLRQSGGYNQPRLHSELPEMSLSYVRPCLRKKRDRKTWLSVPPRW